jgi:hypothetical protein
VLTVRLGAVALIVGLGILGSGTIVPVLMAGLVAVFVILLATELTRGPDTRPPDHPGMAT